jgi:hypothetical protein
VSGNKLIIRENGGFLKAEIGAIAALYLVISAVCSDLPEAVDRGATNQSRWVFLASIAHPYSKSLR